MNNSLYLSKMRHVHAIHEMKHAHCVCQTSSVPFNSIRNSKCCVNCSVVPVIRPDECKEMKEYSCGA